ncbi:MAG TPA: cation:proton antiporter [Phenylobacterium sp.]|jgi:CPA2 family monovalent cation:H+ antiporter-2|uniref:cation:proton antiporter domain-containing protein n=1 Tax=Phenylobacterium sp. TaxID=1871053 RepID=UPI002C7B5A30|nr:cation:proton antiporter [Phenylobacterium sp.]HXA38883.1 cation:proton antiporter [Phenylobacterium sp.]
MTAHDVSPGDYKDLVLFLATAGVVVPLFTRLKISPILGFLGAGVVLGPEGLGALAARAPWLGAFTVGKPAEVAQLAEFGVVFLLFTIGLELSWERLRAMRRLVFGLGGAQVAVGAALLATGGIVVLHLRPLVAAILGLALALSSTAVALPALAERKRLQSPAGRAVFAVLLFQDIAVAPLLVGLSVIGSGAQGLGPEVLLALAPRVGGLLALAVAGRLLLRPMMRSVAKARSPELFVAASLLVVIGAGLVAAATGLSMGLGAFIAGLLLAETEYRHEVEVTVEPFKGLLLGLFFLSMGIGLDLSLLFRQPLLVLGIAAALIALKAGSVALLARLFRLRARGALETGLALAAGGEFAFIVVTQATAAGLLPEGTGQASLTAVTLSMFAIPALTALGARIGQGAAVTAPVEHQPPALPRGSEARVLIVGFGRVGRLVAEMLTHHAVPWTAIERDTRLVDAARREDKTIYFGDASRPELLRRCGLDSAPALVVTMDSPDGAEAVVASARDLRPDLMIVARARDARHAGRLYALGVTDAVPETIEASLQLSESLLVDLGVPMGLVIASIHEKRDEYRKALNRPLALGARGRRARDARGPQGPA